MAVITYARSVCRMTFCELRDRAVNQKFIFLFHCTFDSFLRIERRKGIQIKMRKETQKKNRKQNVEREEKYTKPHDDGEDSCYANILLLFFTMNCSARHTQFDMNNGKLAIF